MTIRYSQRFLRQYAAARPEVRKAFDKQSRLLLENLNHPSLRAKKYDEALGLWQARVNRNWRLYFTIEGGEYQLHDISAHPK
jgi:plasmid maintenance system killer protein